MHNTLLFNISVLLLSLALLVLVVLDICTLRTYSNWKPTTAVVSNVVVVDRFTEPYLVDYVYEVSGNKYTGQFYNNTILMEGRIIDICYNPIDIESSHYTKASISERLFTFSVASGFLLSFAVKNMYKRKRNK